MTDILMILMAGGAVLGGVDHMLGNRLGFGQRFEEAFRLLGAIALSMAGIICLAPVLSAAIGVLVVPVCSWLGFDPGIFGGVLGFLGIWAIIDSSSFWTVFHFLIVPASLFQYLSAGATVQAMNELNWILPDTSDMVRMLLPIFPSIVLRCALIVIIEIVLVVIVAVFIRFAWRKQGTRSPVADIIVIDHDENEPVAIKGPDLVLSHKLSNAPVEKRGEILRRAKNGEPLEDPPKPFPEEETHPVGRLVPETEPSQKDVGDVDPDVPQSETDEVSNTASSEDPQ